MASRSRRKSAQAEIAEPNVSLSNLGNGKLLHNQEILWFDIQMSNALRMKMLDGLESRKSNLAKDGKRKDVSLCHASLQIDDALFHDETKLVLNIIHNVLVHFHDIGMIGSHQGLDFIREIDGGSAVGENLDGDSTSCRKVRTDNDATIGASSKDLLQPCSCE